MSIKELYECKALAEQAQQKPFGYIKPGEGDYEKVFSWNRHERNGYTQAVYTTPQPQQAQHEPVACFSVFRSISGERNTRFLELKSLPYGEHYFYTSPPAQRTWVGLTGDEWQAIVEDDSIDTIGAIKIAIEAKLKEKNT